MSAKEYNDAKRSLRITQKNMDLLLEECISDKTTEFPPYKRLLMQQFLDEEREYWKRMLKELLKRREKQTKTPKRRRTV